MIDKIFSIMFFATGGIALGLTVLNFLGFFSVSGFALTNTYVAGFSSLILGAVLNKSCDCKREVVSQ